MLNPCPWGRTRRVFCSLMLVLGMLAWEKLTLLLIAVERCEQGLYLGNSLPGSLGAVKSIGDGPHAHLAHPDLSVGSAMCIAVLLP